MLMSVRASLWMRSRDKRERRKHRLDEDSSKSDAATRLVYHVPFDASCLNFPIPERVEKRYVNL